MDYVCVPVFNHPRVQMQLISQLISVDRHSKMPMYRQISLCISNAIKNGQINRGQPLPGTRQLASDLNVHRKTVIAAYEELASQDWVHITPQKGVRISDKIPVMTPDKWFSADLAKSYERDFNLPFKAVSSQHIQMPGKHPLTVIDDGYPDIRLSPIDCLLKTYRSFTKRGSVIRNVNIESAQGTDQLRQELAAYLSSTRGLKIQKRHLLITHGAQMGLFLASTVLLDHKSTIAVGSCNYDAANECFKNTGAKLVEVSVDQKGLVTDELEQLCMVGGINALYVIPHHHYPTTVTLSVERRVKLLDLSRRYNFAIIEDDYDFDYHYTAAPYLPLASSDHSGNVIYIGSFSKILGPSIRLGFMIAPENFIHSCTALRRIVDVTNDLFMQQALAEILKNGEFIRHVKKAKKIYHQRMLHLDILLRKYLSEFASYTLPTGGMAIWIRLHSQFAVSKLAACESLHIKKIDVKENAFRLGFASFDQKEAQELVLALKRIFEVVYF